MAFMQKSRVSVDQEVSTVSSIHRSGQKINLLGIVLHKTRVRKVENKDGQQPCRGVFSFVLRDNVSEWINVSVWGSFRTVGETAASFSLGDVVLILQGQVREKEEGSYEETHMFKTPTKYTIVLFEGSSHILPYNCDNKTQINRLRTELLCPVEYHVPLKEIIQNIHTTANYTSQLPQNTVGRESVFLFNFLAAVVDVGIPKAVMLNRPPKNTRRDIDSPGTTSVSEGDNRSFQILTQKCEVTLIDETCSDFPMILWNEELIDFARKYWKPKATVLSVVDCPVRYDTYRRGIVAIPNDRTGIITMPSCEEAVRLGQYAKYSDWTPIMAGRTESQQAFQLTQPFPVAAGRIPAEIEHIPLSGIHTVLAIEDIIAGRVNSGFGIVFATVTKLPVDLDDPTRVLLVSCSNCQRRMQPCCDGQQGEEGIGAKNTLFICGTPNCPFMGQQTEPLSTDRVMLEYNCLANLSDHTGTYMRCVFTNRALETLFSLPPKEFIQLSVGDRALLKWTVLLKRFKIYFWMRQPGFNHPNPYLNVLACETPDAFEVYSSLRPNI